MAQPKESPKISIEERNRMVEENMGLVRWVAQQYCERAPFEDMVQEGALLLMRIAGKWDPLRNVKFKTYAAKCLRRLFARMAWQERNVAIPESTWLRRAAIRRQIFQNRDAYHDEDEYQSIVDGERQGKHSVRKLRLVAGCSFDEYSIDAPMPWLADDGGSPPPGLHDRIADANTQSPEEQYGRYEAVEILERAIGEMATEEVWGERWRAVIRGRMSNQTLAQVGDSMGISRERVRQIQNRAIAELREIIGVDFQRVS